MIESLLGRVAGIKATVLVYAAAIALGGIIVIGIFQTGRRYEAAKCEAAALRAEIAVVRQDLKIAEQAAAAAQRDAEALEQMHQSNQEQIRDLQTEIDKVPADARCRLSGDGVRRMLHLKP